MMLSRGLVVPDELLRLFDIIEPELYRYPAIDPATLRRRVEAVARQHVRRLSVRVLADAVGNALLDKGKYPD